MNGSLRLFSGFSGIRPGGGLSACFGENLRKLLRNGFHLVERCESESEEFALFHYRCGGGFRCGGLGRKVEEIGFLF